MRAVLFTFVVAYLFLVGNVYSTAREIVFHFEEVPSPDGQNYLEESILRLFSRDANFRLRPSDSNPLDPPYPQAYYHIDSLVDWGREIGGRYLLSVTIHEQRIANEKTFNLPLIFQKYEAIGYVDADVRLIDLERGRQMLAEPLRVEHKGPRIIQAHVDDNRNDADIHISAPNKYRFYRELQNKFAEKLHRLVERALRNR